MIKERFILIGLGNPGNKYAETRHNLGFMIIDELAKRPGTSIYSKFNSYLVAISDFQQIELILIKPLIYMNLSGIAVTEAQKVYEVDNSHLLIIHDDICLPFGKLRLRAKGSDGGNKGLVSIIQYLQTQQFPRLKIGIDSPSKRDEMVDYVLSPFNAEELKELDSVIQKATDACLYFVKNGIINTMDQFN